MTAAPPLTARARSSLAWNEGGTPSLRTRYQKEETLDFDEPDVESLPAAEAAPGGKRRRYAKRRRRATSRRRRVAGGRVSKRRRKGRKKRKGGRRRRTKGYTVRKGKVRVYSSKAGGPRTFSASKILSLISPNTVESAANRITRVRRRRSTKRR